MTVETTQLSEPEITQILQKLRRKEGNWLDWASACQQLQKSGLSPQAIFEATGFEPIHQNQIITAIQVFKSLEAGPANSQTLAHFQQRASDCLYELRILNQQERVWGAELIQDRGLDSDGAHEIANALKNAGRITIPESFGQTGGDRVAAYYWNLARQQVDLVERSRLIAQGLSYAQANPARKALEALLLSTTVPTAKTAPRLPFYRLESEEEMPRIVPLVGQLPLTSQALAQVPQFTETGAFATLKSTQAGAFVPIPGWQVIRQAIEPMAILSKTTNLPNVPADQPCEEVLVIVDRGQRAWDPERYVLVMEGEDIRLAWLGTEAEVEILGQVILVLRPKRILDETATFNSWLIDE
ncbi:RuBisCO accumulation factor 1 [Thermosynechococcaceae cyanobacterium BACA0444]|uniref:RuBisCO accumulation factor 1 n=1 Tax=Pseudocalidococcus azoricus BACA0444 TaxID=2918990 RepID=A0AAE4JW51_9CYAN|nr:RuBisCO accumulation factor 1 [Pseudocalidococcus azoricus]MDS3860681.1 RuBisCO accumulation factor 1 [Pseudocalidococcus azoricus BACA0444]